MQGHYFSQDNAGGHMILSLIILWKTKLSKVSLLHLPSIPAWLLLKACDMDIAGFTPWSVARFLGHCDPETLLFNILSRL